MSLKTITFTVGADGILSPTAVQDAGVQGDHRKTELRLEFSDALDSYLQEKAAEGKLVYRFDGYDGEGGVHHSDTTVLCEKYVTYPLEYELTRFGGLVKVELIITLIKDDSTDKVLHTTAAQLKLIFTPYFTGDKEKEYSELSALAEVIKERAEAAVQAARKAIEAQNQIEAVLKGGATYIFQGGNASSQIDVDLIIDDEMSDYSHNPVKNKVAKAYTDAKSENIENQARKFIKNYNYPLGTVYMNNSNSDPAEFLSGKWELIDKEFIPLYKSISIDETNNDDNGYFRYTASTMGSAGLKFRRAGHSIDFTFKVTPNKNITENSYAESDYPLAIPVGRLDLTALGVWNVAEQENTTKIYFTGFSDAGRAVAMMHIDLYNGKIFIDDILSGTNTKDNSAIQSGEDIVFSFSFNVLKENMEDSNCGKFYWQKTAVVVEGELT